MCVKPVYVWEASASAAAVRAHLHLLHALFQDVIHISIDGHRSHKLLQLFCNMKWIVGQKVKMAWPGATQKLAGSQ